MVLLMLGWRSSYPVSPRVLSITLGHTWPHVAVHFPTHPRFPCHTHGERYLRMGERYHKLPLPCIITLIGFPFCRFFFFCRLVSLPTLGQATTKRGALPGVLEAACSPCDDLDDTTGLAAGLNIELVSSNVTCKTSC